MCCHVLYHEVGSSEFQVGKSTRTRCEVGFRKSEEPQVAKYPIMLCYQLVLLAMLWCCVIAGVPTCRTGCRSQLGCKINASAMSMIPHITPLSSDCTEHWHWTDIVIILYIIPDMTNQNPESNVDGGLKIKMWRRLFYLLIAQISKNDPIIRGCSLLCEIHNRLLLCDSTCWSRTNLKWTSSLWRVSSLQISLCIITHL